VKEIGRQGANEVLEKNQFKTSLKENNSIPQKLPYM
jgi:hypothetical protein